MTVPIPEHGTDRDLLLGQVRGAAEGDADWHGGRTFSLVYHHSDEHHAFLEKVVGAFLSTNALNPMLRCRFLGGLPERGTVGGAVACCGAGSWEGSQNAGRVGGALAGCGAGSWESSQNAVTAAG